jgi:cell division FtsZ-interacting protein ZapD
MLFNDVVKNMLFEHELCSVMRNFIKIDFVIQKISRSIGPEQIVKNSLTLIFGRKNLL